MRNTYILMLVQALLTLLLFFSEGYMQYATIGLIVLFDLILFIGLFTRRWGYEELLTLAALICSGIFIFFFMYARSFVTDVFGALLVMLFVVLAILNMISSSVPKRKIPEIRQAKPPEYHYEVQPYYDNGDNVHRDTLQHTTQKTHLSDSEKLTAKAMAYELEREAKQLRDVEKLVKEMEIYSTEKKLLDESAKLEDAQRKIDIVNAAVKDAEKAKIAASAIKKEAKEIAKVQKQITDINKLKQLEKEAKEMKRAEKQIKEIKFLDQQEKMVKQAKAIARAQKDIDDLKNKKTPKAKTVQVRTVKGKDESFYFATETGNKFHEPGCIAIKNVPKDKLTLFTNRKEALKKGLQPCSVCIPK